MLPSSILVRAHAFQMCEGTQHKSQRKTIVCHISFSWLLTFPHPVGTEDEVVFLLLQTMSVRAVAPLLVRLLLLFRDRLRIFGQNILVYVNFICSC